MSKEQEEEKKLSWWQKLQTFVKASYDEMIHHVTWQSYPELQSSSVLVLIASVIFAGLIAAIDLGFKNALDALYNSFG